MILRMYDFAEGGVVSLIYHWRCPKGPCQENMLPLIYNLGCSFMRINHDIHHSDEYHTIIPTSHVQRQHYIQMHPSQLPRYPTNDDTHGATCF